MTAAELERWAIQYRWNVQRLDWLHLYLRRFTVVPSSPDLCRQWAEVTVAAQGAGRRIENGRVDCGYGSAIRRPAGHAQSQRLPRSSGPEASLAPDIAPFVTHNVYVSEKVHLRHDTGAMSPYKSDPAWPSHPLPPPAPRRIPSDRPMTSRERILRTPFGRRLPVQHEAHRAAD